MPDENGNARLRYDYQNEKDICLDCPLWVKYGLDCVHEIGGPPLEMCPIEQRKKKPGPQVPPGHISFTAARKILHIGHGRLKTMIATGQCPAQICGHSRRSTIAIPLEWIKANKP